MQSSRSSYTREWGESSAWFTDNATGWRRLRANGFRVDLALRASLRVPWDKVEQMFGQELRPDSLQPYEQRHRGLVQRLPFIEYR
jgi:hypothetical protein